MNCILFLLYNRKYRWNYWNDWNNHNILSRFIYKILGNRISLLNVIIFPFQSFYIRIKKFLYSYNFHSYNFNAFDEIFFDNNENKTHNFSSDSISYHIISYLPLFAHDTIFRILHIHPNIQTLQNTTEHLTNINHQ